MAGDTNEQPAKTPAKSSKKKKKATVSSTPQCDNNDKPNENNDKPNESDDKPNESDNDDDNKPMKKNSNKKQP
jgi:hypothetical protein